MVTYRVEYSGNSTLKLVGKAETFRYLALGLSENDGLMGDDSVTFCYDARHQIHINVFNVLPITFMILVMIILMVA